jgi:hypothetical protein
MTFSKQTITSSNVSAAANQDVAQEILRAVDELKNGSGFGSIEIVLHDGRVTQIEKREKVRFSQDSKKNNPTVTAAAK